MSDTTTTTRPERAAAIRDGAVARRLLGQGALHRQLQDGAHQIVVNGRAYRGASLDAAIARAKGGGR